MEQNENYIKEQEKRKKFFERRLAFKTVFLNVIITIILAVTALSIVRYLRMDNRSAKDNEQLVMSIVFFLAFLLMDIGLNSKKEGLLERLIRLSEKKYKSTDERNKARIKDLNSALHMLSQCSGVIVWDTIWISGVLCLLCVLVFAFHTCNKAAVFTCLAIMLIFLIGGHFLILYLWKRRSFDQKMMKNTRKYLTISNAESYKRQVEQSIQRGVLGYTRQWILTDEYMIGRQSDIYYDPVAIPRASIMTCTFFYEIHTEPKGGLPSGILKCRLDNGKEVEFNIGRGRTADPVLVSLNEQKIPWKKAETRYR